MQGWNALRSLRFLSNCKLLKILQIYLNVLFSFSLELEPTTFELDVQHASPLRQVTAMCICLGAFPRCRAGMHCAL